MSRRRLLQASVWLGAGALARGLIPAPAAAQQAAASRGVPGEPIIVRIGGYGPPTTSHSQGIRHIGERVAARFGAAVDVRYTYNVLDAGYVGQDLGWLVEAGVFGLVYTTVATGIPALDVAALPFVFPDAAAARAAMAGPLGDAARTSIESQLNCRVLGYFENGFRHVSNNVRPIRHPADLRGLKIRVLQMQVRTFELLGAQPLDLNLRAGIEGIKAGTIDGQENPFANIVAYGIQPLQRYYTATHHSYLSRPLLVHRPSFDAWPAELQATLREAASEAVALQHAAHDQEEAEAEAEIAAAGGEILHLTPPEHAEFVAAVQPLYAEARALYPRELLAAVGI
jgi:TRAP-type C4-dicarboxylate transport system substrate-binding protein